MLSPITTMLRAAILLLTLGTASAIAHEGHDHGDEPPPSTGQALPRGEAHSEAFRIIAILRHDKLAIYLDRFASNEPVTDATIEVETPKGPAKANPQPNGSYLLEAPWLSAPSHLDLIFTVTAGDEIDILPIAIDVPAEEGSAADAAGGSWLDQIKALLHPATLGIFGAGLLAGLIFGGVFRKRRSGIAALILLALMMPMGKAFAHEGHDDGDSAATGKTEQAQRQPDGTVFMPKPVQRILAIRTALTRSGTFPRTIELPGRIIPDPNATGYVQTAVGGRLSAPPVGFPRLGSPVKAGDVVAYITPPLQAIDVSDMRQRQGELDQQINIVERRLARYEQLAVSGAVAKSQLEDTRFELQGLKDRRISLDKAGRNQEALIAPISGVVADGLPVAGQVVQTNAIVMQIIDPAKLWIEALSFESFPDLRAATARTSEGNSLSLLFRGSGLVDRNQSIPTHFAIDGDNHNVRAGQFVTVFASTGDTKTGIALPRSAVVRATNGQHHVFEQVSAERFTPRTVRTAPLDSDRVLILAGIEEGKPIVIQGAELLDQTR